MGLTTLSRPTQELLARADPELGRFDCVLAADVLEVIEIRPLIRVRPRGSRFDRWFRWLERTPLQGFFAFQYILVGRRPGRR